MSQKFSGGLIKNTPPTTTGGKSGDASGIWSTSDALQKTHNGIWPIQQTIPASPTNVIGVTIEGGATVSFDAPTDTGGLPITEYSVIASPGGATATGSSSPINITGLTSGATYSFTVIATNALGSGNASAASPSIIIAQPYGFTSSTTWTVPHTGSYTIYCVGGGAGSSGSYYYGNYYGAGGGSGYYNTAIVSLTQGQSLTINIGGGGGSAGSGGSTSVVSGSTLCSAGGGSPGGNGYGGNGGSGGGPGALNSPWSSDNRGGYSGSNSRAGAGSAGIGQLNVAYGSGTNPYIPPGGNGSYAGGPITYDGIYGFGAGAQADNNQNGIARGGGAGGSSWAQGQHSGNGGMVVIFG